MLSILRILLQEITFQLLPYCYFYKQKEMVIAGVIMGCTSETDCCAGEGGTASIRTLAPGQFDMLVQEHLGALCLPIERGTSIIVHNVFLRRHLREGSRLPFIGCHFHVSE